MSRLLAASASERADPASAVRREAAAADAGREVGQSRAALERDAVSQLLDRLGQLRREILGVLADANASDFRRFTAASLVADVDALIADAQADLATIARSALHAADGLGQDAVNQPINAAKVTLPHGPGLDRALVNAAFDNTVDKLTIAVQQFRNVIVPAVRQVVTAGASITNKMQFLTAKIDGAGGFGNAAFSAERILRTEVGRTLNAATFARLEALAAELPFLRKGWRAAKDGRTRQGHVEAAELYARGHGIPIAEKFAIRVYQEFPHKVGETRKAGKLLGVASLRFPIDPDATPAGRLSAGATILCRCNAFVDFNLAALSAYSLARVQGLTPNAPIPFAPEPPIVTPRKPPAALTAVKAREKLEKLDAKQKALIAEKATLLRATRGGWYVVDEKIRAAIANGEAPDPADLALRGRLDAQYLSLVAELKHLADTAILNQRKALYVTGAELRSIGSRWKAGDTFGVSAGPGRDKLNAALEKEARAAILLAFREASRLAGHGSFGDSGVLVTRVRKSDGTYDTRANATQVNNAINLADRESARVIVHELGHLLEFNSPDIQAAAFRFYERRTAGYPLERLDALRPGYGYSEIELAREDKFAQIYAGKDYSIGGRRYATEIMSLGLEYFYSRPAEFAREDPDFFDFIFNALRGRF